MTGEMDTRREANKSRQYQVVSGVINRWGAILAMLGILAAGFGAFFLLQAQADHNTENVTKTERRVDKMEEKVQDQRVESAKVQQILIRIETGMESVINRQKEQTQQNTRINRRLDRIMDRLRSQ